MLPECDHDSYDDDQKDDSNKNGWEGSWQPLRTTSQKDAAR